MVRKAIVLSLLFAFDVEPVLTVHIVELVPFEIEKLGNLNFVYGIMVKNIQIFIKNLLLFPTSRQKTIIVQ